MIQSMTGFAARRGSHEGVSWMAELRGVNAKGLDIRLRVPDGIDGLEQSLRSYLGKSLGRGSVTLSMRLTKAEAGAGLSLDPAALDAALSVLAQIEERALSAGLTLAQPTAADVLGVRGVLAQSEEAAVDSAALLAAIMADVEAMLADFVAMRRAEGDRLRNVLEQQLTQISILTDDASAAVEARQTEMRAAFSAALRRVVEDVSDVSEDRIAQELALLAVKQDVTEEIDRLKAHVAAARALLDQDSGPVGRKLDFLAQEFNREANTLCSKAQNAALTAIGLDLKAVVDQMREQSLNVE